MIPIVHSIELRVLMSKDPLKSRDVAAQEFMSALQDLEVVLTEEIVEGEAPSTQVSPPPSDTPPVDTLLDEAVKDIEQFMAELPKEAG
jgi:hypothetical protein